MVEPNVSVPFVFLCGGMKNGSLDFKVFKIILEAENGLFWPYIRNKRSV